MSLLRCENCGGEWFKQEAHVKLTDDLFAEGGIPYAADSRWVFRCGNCGETLALERYEVGTAYKPTD